MTLIVWRLQSGGGGIMGEPVVTIITRTKNRPVALDRALRDILQQRFSDWQLVLMCDAGDPLVIQKVVEPYRDAFGDRYRFLYREHSLDQPSANNFATANSQSRYIVMHDDDDTWHPDFLARCVAYLDAATPSVAEVVAGAQQVIEQFDGERFTETGRRPMAWPLAPVTLERLLDHNLWPPIAFPYRRTAGDAVGHYRDGINALSDWDFNVRLARRFEIGVVPEVLAHWHRRPAARGPKNPYANVSYKANLRDVMKLKWEWGQIPPLWCYLFWWHY